MIRMVENSKILCSWCTYNVFVPISKLIVKCYNCGNLKCIDDGVEIVDPEISYDDNFDY
jgi:hypothetical protein